jgi:threonyl-tRNA synthetase
MKIMSVAGAYWRGDEKKQTVNRVYGTSFPNKKDLTEYLHY